MAERKAVTKAIAARYKRAESRSRAPEPFACLEYRGASEMNGV
jgi:hypothetical protein